MKKLIAVLLAVTLVLGSAQIALADLTRGDSGEDVKHLQEMLIETGWLVGTADGKFGPRTERAVMAYQESKGLEQTGTADDALIAMLEAELSGEDEIDDSDAPPQCVLYSDEAGWHFDRCAAHRALQRQVDALVEVGTDESLDMALTLWSDEIERLYADLIADSTGGDRLAAVGALAAWRTLYQDQQALSEALSPDDPLGSAQYLIRLMQTHALELCAGTAQ